MKQNTIKSGYCITVTSWENDADNYKTESIEGLTKDEAKFVTAFVQLFTSKNNHKKPGIGNIYEPRDRELKEANDRVTKLVEDFSHTVTSSTELNQYFLTDGEVCSDGWGEYAYELGLRGGEFFTRVMESFKVEYITQDILIDDVTEEFK